MEELERATCLYYVPHDVGSRRRLPEYLASRKPILVVPSCDGTMSQRALQEYGAAVITPDKDSIKATLTEWYRRFRDQGRLEIPVREDVVQSFSASRKAEQLHEILEEVIADQASQRGA